MLIGDIAKRQEEFTIQEDGAGLFFVASRPGSVFFITGRPNQNSVFFVAANAAIGNIGNMIGGIFGSNPPPAPTTPNNTDTSANTDKPETTPANSDNASPSTPTSNQQPKPPTEPATPEPNVDHNAAVSAPEEKAKPGFVESVVESVFGALDGWLGW